MLYDQAQLVLAYVEAAQLTGDSFFADVAIDTLDYVRTDLTDKAGGFYSAEDADSVPPEQADESHPHKMEGSFYIWHEDEIREVLGADAEVFIARYGVRPDGNAPFDPQNEFVRKNLLYTARPIEEIAATAGQSVQEVEAALWRGREALRRRRASRPRPHLDDKVLTAWNGLMIGAFACAARVLPDATRFLTDARRAADFVRAQLWDAGRGVLLRRYREGESGIEGYAEDYAYLIFGLLQLFQADGDPRWLEWARSLQERQNALFWDPVEGGWFSTTGRDESVLLRLKEDYDGAEPAASSVAVLNLLTLAHLTPEANAQSPESHAQSFAPNAQIDLTLGNFASRVAQSGRTVPMMLAALSTYHSGMPQVVIVGDPASEGTQSLLEIVRARYLPTAITVLVHSSNRGPLDRLLPWMAAMKEHDGQPTAYVCRDFSCQTPTTEAPEPDGQLRNL